MYARQSALTRIDVRRLWPWFVIGSLLLGFCLPAKAKLPKLVSTNLCADLAVLSLAEPKQILSVSFKSHNSRFSPYAELAQRYPANHASAEEVLAWHPDLVVASRSWAGGRHGQLLSQHGIRIVIPSYPRTLPQILEATRTLSAEFGNEAAGERLVASLRQRLDALPQRPLRAIYLRPNGGSAGRDTYVEAVFEALGLINLPSTTGFRGWGRYPLEHLVVQPPEVFVLGFFDRQRPLSKALYGRHPALDRMLEHRPHVRVDNTFWACGGWQLVTVAETIANQLRALTSRGGQAPP